MEGALMIVAKHIFALQSTTQTYSINPNPNNSWWECTDVKRNDPEMTMTNDTSKDRKILYCINL
jgi:hypothetical protein